jgi:hypothetical protein
MTTARGGRESIIPQAGGRAVERKTAVVERLNTPAATRARSTRRELPGPRPDHWAIAHTERAGSVVSDAERRGHERACES